MATQAEQLTGTVERVIFKSSDNGFLVVAIKVSVSEVVMVKGYLPELHEGQRVVLGGSWIFHPKFGRQFEAKECSTQLPATVVGIEKYLASGLIKGIGPKFAQRLVDKFGEKTLDIIRDTPERLLEVGGIGQRRVDSIIVAWKEQQEIANVVVFLRSKDVSTTYAVKIFKAYGNTSIEKITENPYRLVDDIWGIGFKTADGIALKIGLEKDAPARVRAGILYVLASSTDSGHLYTPVQEVKDKVVELLGIDADVCKNLIKHSLHELYNQDKIKLISKDDEHFVGLPQHYFSEVGIAKKILKMIADSRVDDRFNFSEIYRAICQPDARGVQLNEDQQKGILASLQHGVTVITGGPGTGKTTLIKRLVGVLAEHKVAFKLAAPTGRAAKRMNESTGCYTETVHRLLEFSPQVMGFTRNESNALDLEVLIVDEASMIDVFLMHAILRALPQRARLILIGDVDQLPSVGAGNILHDLIDSQVVQVCRLTEIFRQAQDSLIVVNAHRINKGEFPVSFLPDSRRDFAFIKENEPEELFKLLRTLYTEKLVQKGIKLENTVVLVPMNRGVVGTVRINQELQSILNPEQPGLAQVMQFGTIFRQGDRVMQIRNNYDKFVFNGDMGFIVGIDAPEQKMDITFGERTLSYDFTELNELTLSYAISIHKSQGSEFDAVIIPIYMQHFVLLQKNLVYTALTRAKKLCIMVGQSKAIAMAIKNDKGVDRRTFLKDFLTTDLQAR